MLENVLNCKMNHTNFIGRYTATLIEGIDDYRFVGLLDKVSNKNVGNCILSK